MRRLLTLVAVVEGAALALAGVALLGTGAAPCRDLSTTDTAAACVAPLTASPALWSAAVLGGLAGLLVARRALPARQPSC